MNILEHAFFRFDPHTAGSKGLVFIGDNILVYRRDDKTDKFPLQLDLPGGGPEALETPFETFRREVSEEFHLDIKPDDIVYVQKYPSTLDKGKFGYFPVAKLAAEVAKHVQLGDEGTEYMVISLADYIARTDAWPVFQQRADDYRKTLDKI